MVDGIEETDGTLVDLRGGRSLLNAAYTIAGEGGATVTATRARHTDPAAAGANTQGCHAVNRRPSRSARWSRWYARTATASVTPTRRQKSGLRDRPVRASSSQRKMGQW